MGHRHGVEELAAYPAGVGRWDGLACGAGRHPWHANGCSALGLGVSWWLDAPLANSPVRAVGNEPAITHPMPALAGRWRGRQYRPHLEAPVTTYGQVEHRSAQHDGLDERGAL